MASSSTRRQNLTERLQAPCLERHLLGAYFLSGDRGEAELPGLRTLSVTFHRAVPGRDWTFVSSHDEAPGF